jgi:hypothetical protein
MIAGHEDDPEEVTVMTTMMTTMKDWQDRYLDLMKKVETPMVRFTGEMADAVARFVPERPRFMSPLPTTTEMVDNGLKFRKRWVDEQMHFVRSMMHAMEPVTMRLDTVHEPERMVSKMAHRATAAPAAAGTPTSARRRTGQARAGHAA